MHTLCHKVPSNSNHACTLSNRYLSFSLQMGGIHGVILVVLLCGCLEITQAVMRTPKGFKDGKKYKMEGNKIAIPEMQQCRLYCVEEYHGCLSLRRCHLKQNKHRVGECKQEYKQCIENCKKVIHKLETDDFLSTRLFIED